MPTVTGGPLLRSVPAPSKQTLAANYLDFTSGANDWAQQYLPELMEKEAEVFGNRTVSGFLSQIGAEEAMASDQVIWSEQGRLHLAYTGTTLAVGGDTTYQPTADIDGNAIAAQSGDHGVRVGDMVLISDADSEIRCYVSAVDATAGATFGRLTLFPYDRDVATTVVTGGTAIADAANVKLFVFGSEFTKATNGRQKANAPKFKTFSNKPIIMKDYYEVSGSDTAQIGWVEVTGEDNQSGYLWYLKAEGDTRARFNDYTEMAMIEAQKYASVAGGGTINPTVVAPSFGVNSVGTIEGTEGLFAAIESRGNVTSIIGAAQAAPNVSLAEFDAILKEFDKNGAIEENMMFLNRNTALAIDDMLGQIGQVSAGNSASLNLGGTSYGVFENDSDMALNLGFNGFRRGSYDFYKTDWKYLNDQSTRGGMANAAGNVKGVIIPAGVSTVYDQSLGKNLKRPFLHMRYRASAQEDRKMKTWVTGSVGGNITSSLDAMQIHFLTERCLVVQGANNFMLMK